MKVPCNGCTVCCSHETIILYPEHGDVLSSYDATAMMMPDGAIVHVLKHKPNGDCVYLGDGGCTIHSRAPALCRNFDCRGFYLTMTSAERRALIKRNPENKKVLDAGKARLHTL